MTGMEAPGTRHCVSCGRTIAWEANVCPYCGHDYRMRMMPVSRPGSSGARAGGVLILVGGMLAILMGVAALALSNVNPDALGLQGRDISPNQFHELMVVFGVAAVILGFIGVIGGVFALQKRHIGWAIVGGVAGILGVGFVIGAVLAVIGLILIAFAKGEFGQPAPSQYEYPER